MTNSTKATPVTTQPRHRPGFWWPAQQQKLVPRHLAREALVAFGPSLLLDLFVAQSLIWIASGGLARHPRTWIGRIARPLAIAGAGAPLAYSLIVRPWHVRWGATDEEIGKPLPGDELVPHPVMASTRAVTINAPAEAVWPWLVQIGVGRGGWYSYDWLENLAGLHIHSAERIHLEWQDLQVGDIVPMDPEGYGATVVAIEPNRALVMENYGAFVLEPIDATTTRLIVRTRVPGGWPAAMHLLLVEIPHFIMERRMLLGIKRRVEAAQAAQAHPIGRSAPATLSQTTKRFSPWMRAFNKRVLNPLVLGVAGRRHSADYAILRHVGRRSGRPYATPVVAHLVADGFLIALPYGATVDWCGNLQAAGRGSLQWHGKRYEVGAPEVLDASAALPLLPDRVQRALGPFHIGQFLRLRCLTTVSAELAILSGTAQRAR